MRQYKKAVALEEDNPAYLQAAGTMALTIANYDRAKKWLERLLAIRKEGKRKSIELIFVLDRLATLYQYQGDYKKAEPLFQRSLELSEKVKGKEHPEVATMLNNLAGLYDLQGRYEEAEPLHKRALEIREDKLGKDHPDVAQSLNSLAVLYQRQERYEQAEPLYKRALELLEQTQKKE
ncbi:MAG: tetratricopeptide repeat protein, partial [Candidatus Electrothrix sp. AR1]|nr:tetratricopeptide repeat protein [Candidatus Electrothrix sp. AR1]